MQKATGLRVLRRVVERQQSIERDDEKLLRQLRQMRQASTSNDMLLRQTTPTSASSSRNGETQFSRKPPARLKPLHIDNDDYWVDCDDCVICVICVKRRLRRHRRHVTERCNFRVNLLPDSNHCILTMTTIKLIKKNALPTGSYNGDTQFLRKPLVLLK